MSIDVGALVSGLNGVDSINYNQARQLAVMLGTALQDLYGQNATLRATLKDVFGGGDQQGSLDRIQASLLTVLNDINDTSSHAPDDNYDSWPALKQIWINIAIEANTIGAGEDAELSAVASIPSYIGQSIIELPQTLGNVATTVGDAAGSVLEWTGLTLLIVGAIALYIIVKAEG